MNVAQTSNFPSKEPVLDLQQTGYNRAFNVSRMTFGLIAPIEAYPHSAAPTLVGHGRLARKAEEIGFAVLWLRDVPFHDPNFGDMGQIYDPMVYAGWLAARTQRIVIGTAGIVAPLRHPLFVAKQATTVDQLSGGRFVLGLASGDRPAEYPAFGIDFQSRAERYRDTVRVIQSTTSKTFASNQSEYYGMLDGTLDLVPKPIGGHLHLIAIGESGQTIEWIANNMDGWIGYGADPYRVREIMPRWQAASSRLGFKPYGYGTWLDLADNPDEPIQAGSVLRGGRNKLIELWKMQQREGVSHVALSLKQSRRDADEVLDELARYVIPIFS